MLLGKLTKLRGICNGVRGATRNIVRRLRKAGLGELANSAEHMHTRLMAQEFFPTHIYTTTMEFDSAGDKPVSIHMRAATNGNIVFSLGVCDLTAGHMDIVAIAVTAGSQKRITTEKYAVAWLRDRECPKDVAELLLRTALDDHTD